MTGLLAVLMGLPSTYNKNSQENKEPAFDAFDTLSLALSVVAEVIGTIRLRPKS